MHKYYQSSIPSLLGTVVVFYRRKEIRTGQYLQASLYITDSHSEFFGQFRESDLGFHDDAGFHDDIIGNHANTITSLNGYNTPR